MATNYSERRASDAQRRAAALPFIQAARSIERTRPRRAVEAKFLRAIGTPERLIGPADRS